MDGGRRRGGIAPWWHHVGGYQEDRRQFHVVEPFFRWYAEHQQYLVNREPIATVGVVYSQRNFEWYGRDNGNYLALAPYNGMIQALIRARIPYLPVHADHIDRDASQVFAAGSSQPGGHVQFTGGSRSAICQQRWVADRYRRN